MTSKDAVDFIRKKIQIDVRLLTDEEVETTIEVLNMATAALEKQEGKKVRVTTSTKRCPSCNKQVSGIGNIHPNYKYCRYCGQKILWE